MTKKGKQTGAKNKRWFAAMKGWGVDFQVGSGEPQKGKRSLAVSSTQRFNSSAVFATATANTIYTFNPIAAIALGTGSNQREGAAINLRAVSFRYTIESAQTVNTGVVWRVMIVASPAQFSGANFGSGLGIPDLYFAPFSTTVAGHIDGRLAKVLCDTTHELKPRVTGTADAVFGSVDCEINTPFEFRTGSVYGESLNLYVVLTTYTPYGVTGSTATGYIIGDVAVSWST